MTLKKQTFKDGEIAIFDEAVIYKRGEYWQMRMWLQKEGKYARFSLKTRNESTAIAEAKKQYHTLKAQEIAGKGYFSLTTKRGTELYLEQRWKDYEAKLIVVGRYRTLKTHLEHWLNFIGRDTKLKELQRTDCENYYAERTKTKKGLAISQTTVENEQSTINAMMAWLYNRKETDIDGFDFKKLPRVDRGKDEERRSSFSDEEIEDIKKVLEQCIREAKQNIEEDGSLTKVVVCYYLLISIITGLRRGEQLQLRWCDIGFIEHSIGGDDGMTYSLVHITVRGETSKVRKTRKFVVKDMGEYFDSLFQLMYPRYVKATKELNNGKKFAETLIFSTNGKSQLTARAIAYHFDKAIELAQIKNTRNRDLVPYSFRHYFITQRVNSNLTPTQVAEMCGTSVTQIDKTYYHTTREKMISNALADYYVKDGLLIPS